MKQNGTWEYDKIVTHEKKWGNAYLVPFIRIIFIMNYFSIINVLDTSRSLNNITRKIRCVYYGNYFITITIYRFPFIKHKLNSFKCMQIKCFVTNYNKTFSYVCQAFLSNLIKHFIGNYKKDFQWNRSMNMIFCIRFFATFKENY